MLVVLSEATNEKSSRNQRELAEITEAARLFGCRVYTIPPNFDECKTAENALAYVPEFDSPVACVWVGFIPELERYQAIYAQLAGGTIQRMPSSSLAQLAE